MLAHQIVLSDTWPSVKCGKNELERDIWRHLTLCEKRTNWNPSLYWKEFYHKLCQGSMQLSQFNWKHRYAHWKYKYKYRPHKQTRKPCKKGGWVQLLAGSSSLDDYPCRYKYENTQMKSRGIQTHKFNPQNTEERAAAQLWRKPVLVLPFFLSAYLPVGN